MPSLRGGIERLEEWLHASSFNDAISDCKPLPQDEKDRLDSLVDLALGHDHLAINPNAFNELRNSILPLDKKGYDICVYAHCCELFNEIDRMGYNEEKGTLIVV